MSPQQEQEVKRQTKQMIKDGMAHPSTSPWASNVLLVKKKEGTTDFDNLMMLQLRTVTQCQMSGR